ncbi:ANPRA-like protein [Mya arenaria]|uniref:ANPRA-like protein n=1 Tax=Mya arenaria TaxID=6604 RepID=A0ABY7EQX8_MYAAR|nr:ANPRA-like protein [Mya arenaria]
MDLLGIHVFIVVLVACSVINVSRGVDVKIGVLLMTDSWWPFDLKMMGPAIEEGAIVARDVYGVNMELVYHTYPGNCPLSATLGYLMELLNNNTLHAIVGPACSESIMGAARLAEYVKIPMLTGVGDLVVRNPANGDMYKTLTPRVTNVLSRFTDSLTAIMQEYGWRHTAVMYDFPQTIFNLAGANLVKDFRSSIIIIFCNADIFRDIMYQAYLNGMAGGDYVFITLELFPSDWLGHYQLFTRSDYKDAGVTKAYETALILSLRKLDNTEYFTFADKVKARALADHGFVYPAGENPNYYVTAFYDSVMYLANAFNDTVNAGGDITDGMAIAQMYWNSSFQGITGPVGVSEIGDRQADFDLYDMMSPDTRAFQMVGRFRGASQAYVPLNGVEVVWPRGKPLDVPTCGFQGELCVPEAADYTVLIAVLVSVFGFLTLIFSVLFILYRLKSLNNNLTIRICFRQALPRGTGNWPDVMAHRAGRAEKPEGEKQRLLYVKERAEHRQRHTKIDVTGTEGDVTDTERDVTDTESDVTDTERDVTDTESDVTDTELDVTYTERDETDTECDVTDTEIDVTDTNLYVTITDHYI